ncbi:hypothetical protein chiPu_0028887, partial [Chiloscyllium punctatum]|nr:hypothetical protein [Chiloscyllium punctatum]
MKDSGQPDCRKTSHPAGAVRSYNRVGGSEPALHPKWSGHLTHPATDWSMERRGKTSIGGSCRLSLTSRAMPDIEWSRQEGGGTLLDEMTNDRASDTRPAHSLPTPTQTPPTWDRARRRLVDAAVTPGGWGGTQWNRGGG